MLQTEYGLEHISAQIAVLSVCGFSNFSYDYSENDPI